MMIDVAIVEPGPFLNKETIGGMENQANNKAMDI